MEKELRSYISLNDDDLSVAHLCKVDTELIRLEAGAEWNPESDLVCGWQTPSPSYQPRSFPIRKKKIKRPDQNAWTERKMEQSFASGIWNKIIDKSFFTYIPENGCYRKLKCQSASSNINTSRKKPPSPSTAVKVIYSAEQRMLQRNDRRDLHSEFKNLFHNNGSSYRLHEFPQNIEQAPPLRVKDENGQAELTDTYLRYPNRDCDIRMIESQSAQPTPSRLEDLLIKKRCSTHLEQSTFKNDHSNEKKYGNNTTGHNSELINNKSALSMIHLADKFSCINAHEIEMFAERTILGRNNSEQTQVLRPIEKITPSLREVHDNSEALEEILKLKHTSKYTISTASTLKMARFAQPSYDSLTSNLLTISKHRKKHTNDSSSKPRKSKQDKCGGRAAYTEGELYNGAESIQAYLPSVSGKQIATKTTQR